MWQQYEELKEKGKITEFIWRGRHAIKDLCRSDHDY